MFTDVAKDHPHHGDIEDVAAAGIMSGQADGTFDPDGSVTRAQAASIVARALDLLDPEWRPSRPR